MTRPIDEIEHAVSIGREAGGGRGPQHRRYGRLNGLRGSDRASLCQCLDIRDAPVAGELRQQFPIGTVQGKDGDARGSAPRVAPKLSAFHPQQLLVIDVEPDDLEGGYAKATPGQVSGHRFSERRPLRIEL